MRAAILTYLVASQAFAQAPAAPADVPKVVRLMEGQPAPFDGALVTDAQAVVDANVLQDAQSRVSLKVVIVAGALCLLGGAALGVAIERVAHH